MDSVFLIVKTALIQSVQGARSIVELATITRGEKESYVPACETSECAERIITSTPDLMGCAILELRLVNRKQIAVAAARAKQKADAKPLIVSSN